MNDSLVLRLYWCDLLWRRQVIFVITTNISLFQLYRFVSVNFYTICFAKVAKLYFICFLAWNKTLVDIFANSDYCKAAFLVSATLPLQVLAELQSCPPAKSNFHLLFSIYSTGDVELLIWIKAQLSLKIQSQKMSSFGQSSYQLWVFRSSFWTKRSYTISPWFL